MSSRLCEGSCELVTTELKRLKIDRVDLVPEGANSAAFVTLYKGKEMKLMDVPEILSKMKPEHAQVLQDAFDELTKAKDAAEQNAATALEAQHAAEEALAKANKPDDDDDDDDDNDPDDPPATAKSTEGTASFDEDETLLKSLDPTVAQYIDQLRKQKEVAEEVAKTAMAKERHASAVSKAAELKALPIANEELVDFIEKSAPETVDMLSAIAKGIEATVLEEQGSNTKQPFAKDANAAWAKINSEAERLAKERGVTVAKATGMVIAEQPQLYKDYLEGGAN